MKPVPTTESVNPGLPEVMFEGKSPPGLMMGVSLKGGALLPHPPSNMIPAIDVSAAHRSRFKPCLQSFCGIQKAACRERPGRRNEGAAKSAANLPARPQRLIAFPRVTRQLGFHLTREGWPRFTIGTGLELECRHAGEFSRARHDFRQLDLCQALHAKSFDGKTGEHRAIHHG